MELLPTAHDVYDRLIICHQNRWHAYPKDTHVPSTHSSAHVLPSRDTHGGQTPVWMPTADSFKHLEQQWVFHTRLPVRFPAGKGLTEIQADSPEPSAHRSERIGDTRNYWSDRDIFNEDGCATRDGHLINDLGLFIHQAKHTRIASASSCA